MRWEEAPLAPEQEIKGKWQQAPLAESTPGEKLEALGGGAVGSAIESGTALMGGAVGFKAGLAGGPLAPVTAPLGGAIGFLIGQHIGKRAREDLSRTGMKTQPFEQLPEDQRPYAVAGEVVGSSIPFAGLPLQAAKTGARTGGKLVDRVIESAAKSPKTFTAAEAGGIGGAAVAGGVTESYLPGEPLPRVAAEVVGGVLNPANLIARSASSGKDAISNFIRSFSKTGREQRAANVLQDIVTEAGEDPKQLAKALRESGIPEVKLTSAQKTGSPALSALEAKLSTESAKFGAESKRTAEEGLNTLRRMIDDLKGQGTPEALKQAAEMRSRYFRTLIAGRIQVAEKQATDAASKITRDTPEIRSHLSRQANELLEQSLTDVRSVERELWGKVPRDVPARAENIVTKYNQLRKEMLPEEPMPSVVEGFVSRMKEAKTPEGLFKTPQATTTGELLRFRSRALALSREAAAAGKANEARIYGNLAESALDDLSSVSSKIPEFDAARSFSRELNEVFTQTFSGEALRSIKTGAERIPPELLLRRALGTGKESGALQLKQLREAAGFLNKKGLAGPEATQEMMQLQERMIRLSASEAINPSTGQVSTTRLGNFLRNNEELLNTFPEVKKVLTEAMTSEARRKDVERMITGATRSIEKQAAFARVGKFESPADAVKNALSGPTPIKDFRSLAKLAKRGGSEAVEGLRVSVWDDAIRNSTVNGKLSFEKFRASLFEPVRPGQPSLIRTMLNEGIIESKHVTNLHKLFNEAKKIETALARGTNLEQVVQNPDAMFDLVLSVAGAKLGSAMGQVGPITGQHGLIAAGRGASYARQVFGKIPNTRVKDILIEAANDPEFAAMLLEKPRSEKHAFQLSRQINAYLLQVGITGPGESEVSELQEKRKAGVPLMKEQEAMLRGNN